MIEVPAAAIVADGLAQVADFFSVGTNDLVQYTLAADRVNPALAELATTLQPAVLRLLSGVVTAARAQGRHVAVCGEAAADPEMIPLLVGLGVDELSVAPNSVAAVREPGREASTSGVPGTRGIGARGRHGRRHQAATGRSSGAVTGTASEGGSEAVGTRFGLGARGLVSRRVPRLARRQWDVSLDR